MPPYRMVLVESLDNATCACVVFAPILLVLFIETEKSLEREISEKALSSESR